MNTETKKTYVKPTLTNHGKVTEETKGIVGALYEVYGHQPDDTKGN